MFRLLHSADWQLGARFAQFGPAAPRLRAVRLETLRRTMELARTQEVDALLIAGDLFEDNQVDDALVAATLAVLGSEPAVPVYVLPGNHDPFTGPDCVWQRPAWLKAPAHVHVFRAAGTVELAPGVHLVASPLHQKQSTTDPSLKLAELAAALPAGTIRIGLTHGSPAIEARHKPDDFPIALHAATRAGLDYLAIGHWHNWLAETDGGKLVMPGTPEPDNFGNDASGRVALVEFDGPGRPARVRPLPVATLAWRSFDFDFLTAEAARATLAAALAELAPTAARTVVRVTLAGTASPAAAAEVRAWLEEKLAGFAVHQVRDETRVAPSAVELADLQVRHPILAQVLADLDRLEAFANGTVAGGAEPGAGGAAPLTLAEAQALLAPAKIELAALTAPVLAQLRRTLFQTLQEVAK